jgi:hypothetical protein
MYTEIAQRQAASKRQHAALGRYRPYGALKMENIERHAELGGKTRLTKITSAMHEAQTISGCRLKRHPISIAARLVYAYRTGDDGTAGVKSAMGLRMTP